MDVLTIDSVTENKYTWADCIKHYKPEATKEECEYILWEHTCYPFDAETTLEQIKEYFK